MEYGNTIRPIWLNDTRANSDRKKIVCFGDSFITANNAIVGGLHFYNDTFNSAEIEQNYADNREIGFGFAAVHQGRIKVFDESSPDFKKYTENWITKVAIDLDYDFTTYGIEGTGTFYAYYSMIDYLKNFQPNSGSGPDVILFVMSSTERIWNKYAPNICPTMARYARTDIDSGKWSRGDRLKSIYEAVEKYYLDLHDIQHEMHRKMHLCYYIDHHITKLYPNTKFIIFSGFPDVGDYADLESIQYSYNFVNCMEVRPPLIHLSSLDGMPDNLENETRHNHFTPKVHELLSKYISNQIKNFVPGPKYFQIDL